MAARYSAKSSPSPRRSSPATTTAGTTPYSGVADRLAEEAEGQLRKGHKISARDNYLRACSYYRSAEFFLHANADDPRVKRAFELSTACYRQAAALFTPVIEPVKIPFEGTTLTGYFHHADDSDAPRKTRSCQQRLRRLAGRNALDGRARRRRTRLQRAGVRRAWAIFELVHRQGLHFRSNWETVVTPVVD